MAGFLTRVKTRPAAGEEWGPRAGAGPVIQAPSSCHAGVDYSSSSSSAALPLAWMIFS